MDLMTDENESTKNLLNYPSIVNELQSWKGSGQLRWRNNSWDGDFVLVRLLNGRLRFVFKLQDGCDSDQFGKLHNLEFSGVGEDESEILVKGIHFIRGFTDHFSYDINVGYAYSATRHIKKDTDTGTISIRCDLTNYSLNQRIGDVQFKLGGFDIHVKRLDWGKKSSGIQEHASAYQHASLSTCLEIKNIPLSEAEEAIDCLQDISALFSIACRGHVFIAARHIWNQETGKLDSFFEEPPFSDRMWGRPLIPSSAIEDFILAAYPTDKDRVRKLELAYATDHYLQALTLRSIWPQSVGIFTAMESLKVAFFNQNRNEENASYNYWVVPPEEFEANKDMIKELVDILAKDFPRFATLTQSERQSLESQIVGLNKRSYKTQLKRMLTLLRVKYEPSELQFFVNTRNRLIHEGTSVAASTPLNEYDEKMEAAWQHIENAVSLFERALLAFLNYSGPRELFNEGLRW
jgi:hypothetical protein